MTCPLCLASRCEQDTWSVSIGCGPAWLFLMEEVSSCVPIMQGMYKSKLECPQCSHVGVKFDPYMYLSLNLPESKRRTLQVTALYVDGSQPPLQHAVDVPKTGELLPWAKVLAGHPSSTGSCPCFPSLTYNLFHPWYAPEHISHVFSPDALLFRAGNVQGPAPTQLYTYPQVSSASSCQYPATLPWQL